MAKRSKKSSRYIDIGFVRKGLQDAISRAAETCKSYPKSSDKRFGCLVGLDYLFNELLDTKFLDVDIPEKRSR